MFVNRRRQGGSRVSPQECPHRKLLSILTEDEEPGVSARDPRRDFPVYNHCTEPGRCTVFIILFKKKIKALQTRKCTLLPIAWLGSGQI